MYHKISTDGTRDSLTVPAGTLEAHFRYLLTKGYNPILLSDLADKRLPPKPVLLTFDDGYRDNYTTAYPLARKYGIKMNIFLVPDFVDNGGPGYMSVPELKKMDPSLVEFGLHSFSHNSYADMEIAGIREDIILSMKWFNGRGLRIQPFLAYPYGAFPQRKMIQLSKHLQMAGLVLAFRIGNRLNALPLRDPFLVQRIDVRGNEPFWKFRWSLVVGKKWL